MLPGHERRADRLYAVEKAAARRLLQAQRDDLQPQDPALTLTATNQRPPGTEPAGEAFLKIGDLPGTPEQARELAERISREISENPDDVDVASIAGELYVYVTTDGHVRRKGQRPPRHARDERLVLNAAHGRWVRLAVTESREELA